MKKEFTVGDMIRVLSKFDSDLPMYDMYNDENEGECWFNLQKPAPKTKTLYILQKDCKDGIVLRLTDETEVPAGWKRIGKKKILVMYPLKKGEIEVDL